MKRRTGFDLRRASFVLLDNGIRVALAPMPHMASVSLGFWIGVGGRHEPPSLNGISHFIEHMLFKGTRRRSARQISEAVEGIGGYLNAFTSEEHTCFYSKARHDRFPELLDVLTDMLLHSRFAPDDIETERDVIRDEIAMYLDQPQQHVQELLNAVSWPRHPLGRPLTGTKRTVSTLTRRQLQAYHRQHYVGAATVIAVAGHFNPQPTLRTIRRLTRGWPTGQPDVFPPVTARNRGPAVRLATRRIEQTHLALGIRTCSRHDERRFALRLLNVILGENMSSRLFQRIREDAGLAYSIYSSVSFFADTGDLVISTGLDTEHLDRVLRLIVAELRRLVVEMPGRAEFHRARDYALGQIDLGLENTENHMLSVGEQVLGYGRPVSPQTVKRCVARVQPTDLRAAARAFFRPERLSLAIVSPLRRDPGFGRILGRVSS
ncbi:MAG: insulinase family protein [Verrucomicrobia bacterium]|nr:insulinase family protein [Verrucomicrobiota bacterium]OQC65950.1 MAG: Protease 3 precursor [Verrucomicrobia bacterium ADurb.Bin006]MDI9379276.1 pitrilysin family protein [Verrucomicrobiota bacterium]HOA62263.1 pitrilysin family protein [Verrucomicrobiota bacterium]HOF49651.1 pitrilysin family protein [Verrucomicrobiota bacterium]